LLGLIVLGGVFCLGLGALCVPLDISLSFDTTRSEKLSLRVTWLFGFLRVHQSKFGKKPAKPQAKKEKKAEGVRMQDLRLVLQILRVKGMGRAIARLIHCIFLRLEILDLRGELIMGLDDPADTGILMAILMPACIILNTLSGKFFMVRPSFGGAALDGNGEAIVRLFPIWHCLSAARFIFSTPAFTALKIVIETKCKRKI
jgi:hypothetical protein